MSNHSDLTENLRLAVQQARLAGNRELPLVTIEYWESLVISARRELRNGVANPATLKRLSQALEAELSLGIPDMAA